MYYGDNILITLCILYTEVHEEDQVLHDQLTVHPEGAMYVYMMSAYLYVCIVIDSLTGIIFQSSPLSRI